EVDPGDEPQEAGCRLLAAGHQDRDHREGGLAGLADERELPLILLDVADPVRPDENRSGARAADRLFERRDPAQAGAERAAVEEGAQALLTEPAVQLHGDVAVAVGIADEDVIGSAARHGASLFACAGRSIPPAPDSYSKPVAISSCAFELKLRSGPTRD